jgi:O-antigen ligase
LLFLCLCIYLIIFTYIKARLLVERVWRFDNPSLWLAAALLIGAIVYAINYPTASQSTQALTLLTGVTLGRGVWLWPSRQKKGEIPTSFILYDFVLLLLIASLWHTDMSRGFEYRGERRWTSLWDNPNIFGLLMGTGFSLAFALGVGRWKIEDGESKEADRNWKLKFRRYLCAFLCILAAMFMGRGLLHSYSRGAWMATACGGMYLFWHWINHEIYQIHESKSLRSSRGLPRSSEAKAGIEAPSSKSKIESPKSEINGAFSRRLPRLVKAFQFSCISCVSWLSNNWLPLSVILVSAVVLVFWHFQQMEWHPARRALSAVNTVDFSWRNRISAWEGALQIAAEHPWFGAGWNQPERLYEHYYLPPKLTESAAIQMNDYLMLGATLGLPALFSFAMYIWLSLTGKSEIENRKSEIQNTETGGMHCPTFPQPSAYSLQPLALSAACRAGAIVLLVGFWFDGGLFNLATASTFWILLELGSAGNREICEPHEND